jgi:hypothetical protein
MQTIWGRKNRKGPVFQEDDVSAVVMEDALDRRHHTGQPISDANRATIRPSKYIPQSKME